MKLSISSSIVLLALAQAIAIPIDNFAVTKQDIDVLIHDAARAAKSKYSKAIPLGDFPTFPVDKYQVQLVNAKLWIGDTAAYSESSTLNDGELVANVDITQANVRSEGTIKAVGQGVSQKGTYKLIWSHDRKSAKAVVNFDEKSVTLADFYVNNDVATPTIDIKGLNLPGLSKDDLEQQVLSVVINYLKETANGIRQKIPGLIAKANKKMKGHTLQEVYDYLRSRVPKSGY